MTILSAHDLVLPAASLGAENPLAPLRSQQELHQVQNLADAPADLRENIEYGRLHSTLPCLNQDGYDRELVDTAFPALMLENDHVRATILPSLGGRLYSLVHKASGQELLYRNPVFQPANLALRNAWFAGGVEWNVGSTGHWTGTCAPMHAARVEGPDGTPILRLWELERTRNLITQLDFWLPADSEFLYVGVRLQNPSDHEVPAYWWSNIAVEQSPETRVLVPADEAWRFGYAAAPDPGRRLDLIGVPEFDGIDLTYPMRHPRAVDFFFEPMPDERPWIASVDAEGNGLVQASTDRLRGRKLFVWGEGAGGRRWQEWLAPGLGGHGYAEIQAGLARTQLEHLKLPVATSWHWLEAYGRLSMDPIDAHSDNWQAARTAAASVLRPVVDALADRERSWLTVVGAAPVESLAVGSGWGALELARTGWSISAGTPFADDTMTPRERAWLPLLDGRLPAADDVPDGTLVSWRELLENAEDNWLVWYHRGVARHYDGDRDGAIEAWTRAGENPFALRNLGFVTGELSYYERAVGLRPDLVPLVAEAVALALDLDLDRAGRMLDGAPDDPRIRLLRVRYALDTGDAQQAHELLADGIQLATVREGANPLTDYWLAAEEALGTNRPVPPQYQFGMGEN
ncbi:DUF5107 domain-containing protein [Kribbella capetownensis]|uniref:DUF5107 domain-containing protein n=1 Tax=Kribbella capetownensis TaxID=1572659 RepID=A0A4V2M6I6_9ACTN|nr:DUF5107 domain-containing protein [Kribbella capetownensis]TCC43842.1 DUF5107 domain-containing protein [Kribbella capetownensis]